MKIQKLVSINFLFILFCFSNSYSQDYLETDQINISIIPDPKTVGLDTVPKFQIRLTNESNEKIEVRDVWSRHDLLDRFTEIHIFNEGKEVECLWMISDPGSLSDEIYISVNPKSSIQFQIDTGDQWYSHLGAGTYSVYAIIRTYLYKHREIILKSNSSEFEVVK